MKKIVSLMVGLSLAATAYCEAPPFTTLEVSTSRGIDIDRSGSSVGDGYSRQVKKTDRKVAVEIKYRTLRDIDSAFEIQCFFIGRDAGIDRSAGESFVYDAYRFRSKKKEATILATAKNLYGGTRIDEVSTTTGDASWNTSSGRRVNGVLTTTTHSTTRKSGARSQGWIVRLFYNGKLVQQKASLHELERFATEKADYLSSVAEGLPFSRSGGTER